MTTIVKNYTILNEVHARLVQITTTNEYQFSVKKVTRAKLTPYKPYDLPAINYWPLSLANTNDVYRMDTREISLNVEIHSQTSDDPFTDKVDILAANVVTALNRKTTKPKLSDPLNKNLGGLVDNFSFGGYTYLIGEGQHPYCGALLTFTIKFKTDLFDMFT